MSSITLWGAVYDTDYVDLPKTGGGTVRFSEGGGGDEPSGPTYVNIVPEQTFTPTADYSLLTFTEPLVVGETYRYIVNGVEKTGVAADFYGSIVLGSYADYNSGTGGAFECANNNIYYDTKLRTAQTVQVDRVVEGSGGGGGSTDSNPLKGKIAAFTGDSLCAGAGYTGGYAGIIGTDYEMTVQNIGTSEGTIVRYQSYFCISESIANLRSDADFVLLEGGGNDAWYGTQVIPLGTLSSGYSATLDTTTFAGAFENMLKSAIARFQNAKIGYIFPHKCIANFDSPNGAYRNMAISALEKWGIPYCDLNVSVPPLGYIDSLKSTYTAGDGIHPNEAGYRTFYVPKIVAFMQTMLTDKSLINKTVTANGTYIASDDDADGYDSVTVNVSGSGSSKNVQTEQSTSRRNNTALGSVTSLTCEVAGTYDVYWTCTRSSTSGTWGSQLYINGTAYGTENTVFSNNVQNNHLSGVQIPANATVAVYGRSRSGYYIYVQQLTIQQTA
jgi:lysophospholipase L1-like esterase